MKKNFLKTPIFISAKLEFIADNEIIVTALRSFSKKEIETNVLSKIGIKINNDAIDIPNELLPLSASGRYSRRNREGYYIVRKDLPKVYKTIDCCIFQRSSTTKCRETAPLLVQ